MNKKEEKRKITRQKIIDAATHLFARQGYHKTTMQEIALHINMTTGAIFHHFTTKKIILEEVVKKHNSNMDAYVAFLLEKPRAYGDMINGLVAMFVKQFHSDPDAIIGLTSLSAELSETGEKVVDDIRAAYDRFVDAFEAAIDHLPATVHKREAAISFISGIQGLAIQALLRKQEIPFDDLVKGFIDTHNKINPN
jgi:AcrR family transcriptional regulator